MTGSATDLRVGLLVGRTLAAGLAAAAIGTYPTWRLVGWPGLWSMAAAAFAAVIGYAVALAILLPRVRRGPREAGMGFLLTGPVRLVATLGLATLAWVIWRWPAGPLFVWSAIIYVVFLAAEVSWLAGLLRTGQ